VLINDHKASVDLLRERGITFNVVNLSDIDSDWESKLIQKFVINVWLNDRLDTDIRHAANVKKNNITLVAFDDRGSGSELCDLHFAALSFKEINQLKGKKVFTGVQYLILNPEIKQFQRLRTNTEKIIVSLGGSDTYGVTVKVVQILKRLGQSATIHIGPSFKHRQELKQLIDGNYTIVEGVSSLIKLFSIYDLAITGGGITPFEANASGLPCIIIANELFEIPAGEFLHSNGSSFFTCYHKKLNPNFIAHALSPDKLNIESMSRKGMESIPINAVEKIYQEIK